MRNTIVGFYGKIPSHRDFIHSNLPRSFIDSWDPWLQNLITHWRSELTGDWVADYLTMSPYRFVLSRGIAGEVNWLGVLVPSRDHVGRLFPLTICIPLSSQISPFTIQQLSNSWLDKIENLAIDCLQPNFEPESVHTVFAESLYQLGLPDLSGCSGTSHIDPDQLLHEISCAREDDTPIQKQFSFVLSESSTRPLAESLLNEFCHAYSLWWSKGDKDILHSQGLPHKSISPALIDKQWSKWGWLGSKFSAQDKPKVLTEDDTQTF